MRILRVGSMCIYQWWWYESRPLRKYARVSDLLSSVRGPARETYILCFSHYHKMNMKKNVAKVQWLIIIQADDLHVEISALWVKAHRTDCLAQPSFMQCLDPCSFDQSKHSFSVIVCTCILIIWPEFKYISGGACKKLRRIYSKLSGGSRSWSRNFPSSARI